VNLAKLEHLPEPNGHAQMRRAILNPMHGLVLGLMLFGPGTMAAELPQRDGHALFDAAEAADRVGLAQKTKPVDARPARPGEIIITKIADEGEETRSKPAEQRDWVVRNRCSTSGNEEYLVKAKTFAERYEGPLVHSDGRDWQAFRPRGPEMRFFVISDREGAYPIKGQTPCLRAQGPGFSPGYRPRRGEVGR
jgi:hypothetical protein